MNQTPNVNSNPQSNTTPTAITEDVIKNLPFTLHGYQFVEVLGSGGFSTVFKVQHVASQQFFAAKCLTVNDIQGKDLSKANDCEIYALTQLYHPNIVKIYEVFTELNRLFIIIELCKGGTLTDFVQSKKLISMSQQVSIMKQCLKAIDYCHKNNIAHRDIKPANIFFDPTGRCMLGDFGISYKTQNENEKIFKFSGSLLYEAPEMLQKIPYDPMKADIWSLGITFYYLIEHCLPWPSDANLEEVRAMIKTGLVPMSPDIPEPFQPLLRAMLNWNPNQRPSAEDLLQYPIFNNSSSNYIPMSTTSESKLPQLAMRSFSRFKLKNRTNSKESFKISPQKPRRSSDYTPYYKRTPNVLLSPLDT